MNPTPTIIPAFVHLTPEELQAVFQLSSPVMFSHAADLPFVTATGEHIFYIITKGHAKLSYEKHERHPVRICGPGDVLGYGEWYSKSTHKAECLDPISGWKFLREPFQQLLHVTPNLQECMIQVLCQILTIKDERISALENHSVSNRVASVLLSLSEKFGKETHEGLYIDVKVDRDTIAKLAGTVTESLSRQLSELEEEDIIYRNGRAILIKDRRKLEQKSRQ
jgi:CRP-like cAMP-binding protein